jgi:hypothetical protein
MANSVGNSGRFISGEKTVSSAGTAEAIEADDIVHAVTIIAVRWRVRCRTTASNFQISILMSAPAVRASISMG